MKLLNNKNVKVGDLNFPIRITNRAMIDFEALSGGTISKMDGTEKLVKFFYCTAKAGAKSENISFTYSYEEFLDVIDDYFSETITNFSLALAAEQGGDEKK
jgi:hypothetical protein